MIPVTFRPLSGWPDPIPEMRNSPFQAHFSDTLILMDKELRALDAERVVIQVAVQESDIRLDGWPRAGARPEHHGVILSFESKHGPLRYATRVFPHWHDNLRAIALGLEALRKVDRYGITRAGEQYTGWKQLTAGNGQPTTEGEAIRVLAAWSDFLPEAIKDNLNLAYKQALKKTHPDVRPGEGGEDFFMVREAGRVLGVSR